MACLSISLLGAPRIERDGTPIRVRRRKAVALLAYLAVTGQSQSRDTLATLLWPEQSQSSARASLRSTLSVLKKDLGTGWLESDRETVHLGSEAAVWLDVAAFGERLAACRTHDCAVGAVCPDCLSNLAEAAGLYHDEFMAGFTLRDSPAFDEWQFFQGEGLRRELAFALERLVRGHTAQGVYEMALSYARRWLALDPLHEPAHRALMRLYARSGQRAAALRQYGECERLLQEELGAAPAEETTSLYQAIVERRALGPAPEVQADLERSETPAAPGARPVHRLPASVTPFVGRQAQLDEVRALLARKEVRLLTLTGAGGTGKTRLALEVAARLVGTYPDGIFFVSLAPVSDPALVLPAIATALGVRELAGRSPLEALQQALRDKRLLLVVDNCEHVLPAAPSLAELLAGARHLKVLATSRAPLQVYAEREYAVPPMTVPRAEDLPPLERFVEVEAVQLFAQRARAVRADLRLDAGNARAVAEICTRLDGLPLAIELAAAWARMLTPSEILSELGRGLDFLESERRDVPARQRSMRAVFDHSWSLLSPHEREVLQVASVFRGGFTRGAAERVAGASLRDLRALVSRSLLHRAIAPRAAAGQASLEPRYEMHELFRQYAQGKLDGGPQARLAARDQHCAFYCAALQRWDGELKGPGQVRALSELEAEVGNVRAAWEWAVQQGYVECLDQGMDGLCRFYEWRGRYQEGEAACRLAEDAITAQGAAQGAIAPADHARVLAKALVWRAVFARAAQHVDRVLPLLERGLGYLEQCESADVDVRRERAFALWQMADAAYSAGHSDARQWYEQSLALYRALDDRWGIANVLYNLGHDVLGMADAFAEGETLVRESLAIRQALGDQRGMAMSRRSLSNIVCLQGHVQECERLLRQCLPAFEHLGDQLDTAQALTNLSYVLLFLGKPAEAYSYADQGVALLDELGLRDWIAAMTLSNRGQTALWLGRTGQARADARAGLDIAQEVGKQAILAVCLRNCGMAALVDGDQARAVQLLMEGLKAARQLGHFHTDTCAVLLGLATLRHGQPDQARRYLKLGLGAALQKGSYLAFLYGLPPATAFLLEEGEMERAVELYALATQQPFVSSSRWYEDLVGRHIAAAAETLPPQVVAAAQERGRARDLWVTVAELVAELGQTEG